MKKIIKQMKKNEVTNSITEFKNYDGRKIKEMLVSTKKTNIVIQEMYNGYEVSTETPRANQPYTFAFVPTEGKVISILHRMGVI